MDISIKNGLKKVCMLNENLGRSNAWLQANFKELKKQVTKKFVGSIILSVE